jgi:hypothetical protein
MRHFQNPQNGAKLKRLNQSDPEISEAIQLRIVGGQVRDQAADVF